MATAERKARKAAGIKHVRVPKVGTPPEAREENQPHYVAGPLGTGGVRLTARIVRRLRARGIEASVDQ